MADLCDRKGLTIAYDDMLERRVRGDDVRKVTLIAGHVSGGAESMIHSLDDGGVRDMVLNPCMRGPWSKDGDGAAYVGAAVGAHGGAPSIFQVMFGDDTPGGQGMVDGAP